MEVVERINEVDERASETVDAYHDERVSTPQAAVTLGPLCAFHSGAAGMVDVDGVAPCGT